MSTFAFIAHVELNSRGYHVAALGKEEQGGRKDHRLEMFASLASGNLEVTVCHHVI